MSDDRGEECIPPHHQSSEDESSYGCKKRPQAELSTRTQVEKRKQYCSWKKTERVLHGSTKKQLFSKSRKECQHQSVAGGHWPENLGKVLLDDPWLPQLAS